jgi:hypothetical protein
MLGRKDYTKEEFDNGKRAIQRQLTSYRQFVDAATGDKPDKETQAALDAFETEFFNNMTLVLDRLYVHRLSGKDHEGKDGNPLNELRLIVDSLLDHKGVMRVDKQIKLPTDKSVLGIDVGDTIKLTEDDFKKLSKAFFEELKRRFVV